MNYCSPNCEGEQLKNGCSGALTLQSVNNSNCCVSSSFGGLEDSERSDLKASPSNNVHGQQGTSLDAFSVLLTQSCFWIMYNVSGFLSNKLVQDGMWQSAGRDVFQNIWRPTESRTGCLPNCFQNFQRDRGCGWHTPLLNLRLDISAMLKKDLYRVVQVKCDCWVVMVTSCPTPELTAWSKHVTISGESSLAHAYPTPGAFRAVSFIHVYF